MSKHHVEMFNEDSFLEPIARPWGWQCLTCGAEQGGYATLGDAGEGADEHERENA